MPRTTNSSTPLGLVLLPLRAFVGITFVYAGLQKFFSGDYWSTTSTTGFLASTQAAVDSSPIGFILNHTLEHSGLFAFAIASGELLAGLGLLLGIWTRAAALGAFALSSSFWLTVSWNTHPYFYGSDIVFMAAVIPLIIAGDAEYMSAGNVIRERVLRQHNIKPGQKISNAPLEDEIRRRTLVQTGAVAGALGAVGILAGLFGKSQAKTTAAPEASSTESATPTATDNASGATKIATLDQVKVGGSLKFSDAKGIPAYLVQPKKGTYMAFSAVCTHEGCIVNDGGASFQCPCHGAQFSASTGDVQQGPARKPLEKVAITVAADGIYLA